jgi:hypothetical protein
MWKYITKLAEGEKKIVYSCDVSEKSKYSAIRNDSKPVGLVCRKMIKNKGILYQKGDLITKKKDVFIVKNMRSANGNMKKNEMIFSKDAESEKIGMSFCEYKECTAHKAKQLNPDLTLTQFNHMNSFFRDD